MKILVLGDWYCPAKALQPAFASLAQQHEVAFADLPAAPGWIPETPSEQKLQEYVSSPRHVLAQLVDHDILVVHGAPITDAVLDAAPSLKLVCVARGGPVNIDVAAATARRIPVVTTPGKNADAVADLTLAFLIMLARRIPEALRYVESGADFGRDNFEGAKWFGYDLAGHALGLIGLGQVGHRVAHRAAAFGMTVLACDPYLGADVIRAAGAEPVDLETLLGRAHFVSLHARATTQNRGMIGCPQIALMRRGAYLINTARETLVDEDALYDALKRGQLGGGAFDVTRPPEPGRRHRLLDFPNVVIVAHLGGATYETLAHGGEMAAAEIQRFVNHEPLRNVANPQVVKATGMAKP